MRSSRSMVRRDRRDLGVPRTGLPLTTPRVRRTRSCMLARSTSCHMRPQTSPLRMPVRAVSRMSWNSSSGSGFGEEAAEFVGGPADAAGIELGGRGPLGEAGGCPPASSPNAHPHDAHSSRR